GLLKQLPIPERPWELLDSCKKIYGVREDARGRADRREQYARAYCYSRISGDVCEVLSTSLSFELSQEGDKTWEEITRYQTSVYCTSNSTIYTTESWGFRCKMGLY